AGGLEGWEDKDTGGDTTWYRLVLELYAPDAHWHDPTPITLRFAYPTGVKWFPILPLKLGAGAVLGDATLTNPGDVDAWPTWTVTGPGTAVSLDNTTTGETLDLVGDLASGTLVIVTEPGQQSITLDGVDWWDKLTGSPTLWQVPPGDTAVSLALTGAAAGSSVQCSFFPLYRSAW
ncbi:phage distal tail protein, partial [Actinophytocola sediminis]